MLLQVVNTRNSSPYTYYTEKYAKLFDDNKFLLQKINAQSQAMLRFYQKILPAIGDILRYLFHLKDLNDLLGKIYSRDAAVVRQVSDIL